MFAELSWRRFILAGLGWGGRPSCASRHTYMLPYRALAAWDIKAMSKHPDCSDPISRPQTVCFYLNSASKLKLNHSLQPEATLRLVGGRSILA